MRVMSATGVWKMVDISLVERGGQREHVWVGYAGSMGGRQHEQQSAIKSAM